MSIGTMVDIFKTEVCKVMTREFISAVLTKGLDSGNSKTQDLALEVKDKLDREGSTG